MNQLLQQLEAPAVRREVRVLGLAALYLAGRHDMAVAQQREEEQEEERRSRGQRSPRTCWVPHAGSLKYLATGINYKTLMQGFRVSSNNMGLIVREVCGAIVEEYRDEVINCPKTEEEWKETCSRQLCHPLELLPCSWCP